MLSTFYTLVFKTFYESQAISISTEPLIHLPRSIEVTCSSRVSVYVIESSLQGIDIRVTVV